MSANLMLLICKGHGQYYIHNSTVYVLCFSILHHLICNKDNSRLDPTCDFFLVILLLRHGEDTLSNLSEFVSHLNEA